MIPTPRLSAAIALVVVTWSILLFSVYRPGIVAVDTLEQYRQGVERSYGNGSPATLSILLGFFHRLVGSPWPVFLGQLAALGLGLGVLARSNDARRGRLAVVALACALALPTTWALGVILWKDIITAAAFLIAVVLLHHRHPLSAFAAVAFGVTCRYNAIFAALPLLIPIAAQLPPLRTTRRRVAALVLGMLLLALAPKAVERAVDAKSNWMLGTLLLYDIAGIYSEHPAEFGASRLSADLSIDYIKACYTPISVNCLIWPISPGQRAFGTDNLGSRQRELAAEWIELIGRHPLSYAKHRLRVFRKLLGADGAEVWFAFQQRSEPNRWGFKTRDHTIAYRLLDRARYAAWNTLAFRGWFWLLAATSLAAYALFRRGLTSVPFAAAASGAAYALGYLPVTVAADFRYLYWTAIAALAALILLVAHGRPSPSEPPARVGH